MTIGTIIAIVLVYALGFGLEFAIVETKNWFPPKAGEDDNFLSVLACVGSWLSVVVSVGYLIVKAFREAGQGRVMS